MKAVESPRGGCTFECSGKRLWVGDQETRAAPWLLQEGLSPSPRLVNSLNPTFLIVKGDRNACLIFQPVEVIVRVKIKVGGGVGWVLCELYKLYKLYKVSSHFFSYQHI